MCFLGSCVIKMLTDDVFKTRLYDSLSHYRESISLIDDLLKRKLAPQEIVLLTCGRLDSLANLAFPNKASQQETFCRFISHYSGQKRFFNSVSVGDLYWEFMYYSYVADGGLISIPGRIRRFGQESDIFLSFVEKSKVPITGKAVENIAFRIANILQKHFNVKKRQLSSKPKRASSAEIKALIYKEIRRPNPDNIVAAINPMLEYFTCERILYRDYRNNSVHGLKVDFSNDEFFDNSEPYFSWYEHLGGELSVNHIQFPGRYLKNLLEKCLDTFSNHLLSKKVLPWELYNSMFSFDESMNSDSLDYLDENSMNEFEDVRWQLRTR